MQNRTPGGKPGVLFFVLLKIILQSRPSVFKFKFNLKRTVIFQTDSAFPSSLLLYPSPHAHMASKIGFRLYPSSVSVYSTRGGTSA